MWKFYLENLKEHWRFIPEYENSYKVSTYGRILSCARTSERTISKGTNKGKTQIITIAEKFLKPSIGIDGYLVVNLRKNNETKMFRVHQLVVWAFLDIFPSKTNVKYKETRHLDENKLNNHIYNLKPDTIKANSLDRDRHGTSLFGSDRKFSKLSAENVGGLRRDAKQGASFKDIAEKYGISTKHVKAIVSEKYWNSQSYLSIINRQFFYMLKICDFSRSRRIRHLIEELRQITNNDALLSECNRILKVVNGK